MSGDFKTENTAPELFDTLSPEDQVIFMGAAFRLAGEIIKRYEVGKHEEGQNSRAAKSISRLAELVGMAAGQKALGTRVALALEELATKLDAEVSK